MRAFFDNNIIIDALSEREGAQKIERSLLYGAVVGKFQGLLASKQLTDIYYVLRRYIPNDVKRRELLAILLVGFEVIPTEKELLLSALDSPIPDFEDAVIAGCAEAGRADFIVTNDAHGFSSCPIPVKTPEEAAKVLGIY